MSPIVLSEDDEECRDLNGDTKQVEDNEVPMLSFVSEQFHSDNGTYRPAKKSKA